MIQEKGMFLTHKLGRVLLGNGASTSEAITHWENMVANKNKASVQWHTIQTL